MKGSRRSLLAPGAAPAAVYLALTLVAPVALLVLYSFWTAGFFTVEPILTLANYAELLSAASTWSLLARTIGVGLLCAVVLSAAGFVVAYAITFKLKRWGPVVLVFVTGTLLASYLVRIYAWKTILGTRGLLNAALLQTGLISEPLQFLLYGYFAIVVTLVYVYLPFAVLLVYAGLQNIDPRVFEASRDLGAGRWRTLARVTIPLAATGLRSAFAVSFILCTADYVTPGLVGGLDGQMVGRVIADQFGAGGNLPRGAALSVLLVTAMAVTLLAADRGARWIGTLARGNSLGGAGHVRRSPRWRVPWSQAVTAALLLFLIAPLAVVVVFSLNAAAVPGLPFEGVTLQWYGDVLTDPAFLRVLRTSVLAMLFAVAAALLLAVPAALAVVRQDFRLRRLVGVGVMGPVAVPGVVVGVALLTTFIFIGVRLGLSTIVVAHALLIVPFVFLVVRSRLVDLDPRIDEAARDLGAAPRRVFRTITLPLLLPSLIAAALLGGAVSLDDVIVTNFVAGTSPTVPVWILGLMRRTFTPQVNVVAVIMLTGSLGLIALAGMAGRLGRGRRLADTLGGGE